MFKHMGFDFWKYDKSLDELHLLICKYDLEVYDISFDESIYFYTSISNRKILRQEEALLIHTTGFYRMVFKNYKSLLFYIRMILIVCVWYVLQNMTFHYELIGQNGEVKQNIENELHQMQFPQYHLDTELLKEELYRMYNHQLSWLEVYSEGSKLIVTFSEKKVVTKNELFREPLFATKDAVIVSFDVQHGNKVVKKNDFVYKGSVLVDSYMLDSFQNQKDLFVKGSVYGYTWYTIESKMNVQGIHDGLAFFRLLFDCRHQISNYLSDDEKIVIEMILQYTSEEGLAQLIVHYTLLEDITIP